MKTRDLFSHSRKNIGTTCAMMAAVSVVGLLSAAEIKGTYLKPACVDIDEPETVDGPVWAMDSEVCKDGEGTLSVYLNSILPLGSQVFNVFDGMVNLLEGGVRPSVPEPAFLRRDAAMWLSMKPKGAAYESPLASRNVNGNVYVDRWYDVRENDVSAAGFAPAYWNAKAVTTLAEAPEVKNISVVQGDGSSVPSVYFGGYANNRYMTWQTPADKPNSAFNVRHVFAVHRTDARMGVLFGYTNSSCYDGYFPPSDFSISWQQVPYFMGRACSAANVRFRRNGLAIDGTKTYPANGRLELIDITVGRVNYGAGGGLDLNAFFTDRQLTDWGSRNGGDYICEAIVFTNALSQAEISEVEAYLVSKWDIRSLQTPSVRIAADASNPAEVDDAGNLLTKCEGGVVDIRSDNRLVRNSHEGVKGLTAMTLGHQAETQVAAYKADPVRLESGAVYDVSYSKDARVVKRTATPDIPGVIETRGSEDLVTDGFASSVREVRVTGGRLVVNAHRDVPQSEGDLEQGPYVVKIKNPGFENKSDGTPFEGSYCLDGSNGAATFNAGGWTVSSMANATSVIAWWRPLSVSTDSWPAWFPFERAPEGNAVLGLKKGSVVYQEVEIPTPGIYAISYAVTGRRDHDFTARIYAELIDKETDEVYYFGDGKSNSHSQWDYLYFKHEIPKAGTYRLQLGCVGEGDGTATIDDVSLVRLPKQCGTETYLIPNGDFENNDHATGWVFGQSEDPSVTWNGVSVITRSSSRPYAIAQTEAYDNPFFQSSRSPAGGLASLCFSCTRGTGTAVTTFTPPKGRWYLKGNLTRVFQCRTLALTVSARVKMGGASIDLGAPTLDSVMPKDYFWPKPFDSDGTSAVTLTLSYTANADNTAITADDFELVSRAPGDSVVVDGSFEDVAGDTDQTYLKNWVLRKNGEVIEPSSGETACFRYSYSPDAYGKDAWGGARYVRLSGYGSIEQDVTFQSSGRYRLSVSMSCRRDAGAQFQNAYARVSVGDVFSTTMRYGYDHHMAEHAFDFTVTEAGTKKLTISHETGFDWTESMGVDGVSIVKVGEIEPVTTVFPTDTVVRVSSGARLYLGFSGENEVGKAYLGGKKRIGVINAQTYPEFIEGPGALVAKPSNKGLFITVR